MTATHSAADWREEERARRKEKKRSREKA